MFNKWLAQAENETGLKFMCMKLDNGGEYYDEKFEEFYMNLGIR